MFVCLAILLSLPTGTCKCIGMYNEVVHLVLASFSLVFNAKTDLNSSFSNSTDTLNYIAVQAELANPKSFKTH